MNIKKCIGQRDVNRFMCKYFNDKPVIGVEVGVYLGDNAKRLYSILNVNMLYLIDSWKPYVQFGNKIDIGSGGDYNFEFVKNRFKGLVGVDIRRIDSMEGAKEIIDGLDFVYIDGNHDYEHIKEDIEAWYPKVKSGGVLAGHDYCKKYSDVIKASHEFADKNDYELKHSNIESELMPSQRDWWIVKR